MNLLHAVILGVVEGVTEFLPISSTGHLILAAKLMKLPDTPFLKTFEIAIQVGAILSVLALYWKRFLLEPKVLLRVAVAFIPTAILGLLFYKTIKQYFLSADVVIVALFVGGLLLIVFEKLHKESESALDEIAALPYSKAALIGVFQAFAFVPGVSRAAATILGGLLIGMKRKTIVEFSFLLAVPTMLAATALDILKNRDTLSSDGIGLLLAGGVTAFIVALFCIRFFIGFIRNHDFKPFGWYRIAVAAVFTFFVK